MNEWREDVKRVLRAAGGQGRDVVFLILDSQLQNDAFLQDIDSLLNSGLVPNIFTVEEKQEIIEVSKLHQLDDDQLFDLIKVDQEPGGRAQSLGVAAASDTPIYRTLFRAVSE